MQLSRAQLEQQITENLVDKIADDNGIVITYSNFTFQDNFTIFSFVTANSVGGRNVFAGVSKRNANDNRNLPYGMKLAVRRAFTNYFSKKAASQGVKSISNASSTLTEAQERLCMTPGQQIVDIGVRSSTGQVISYTKNLVS